MVGCGWVDGGRQAKCMIGQDKIEESDQAKCMIGQDKIEESWSFWALECPFLG